jgi:hypothetical protein
VEVQNDLRGGATSPNPELPSLTVYPWVSRFSRWPPGLTVCLENLTEPLKWSFVHGFCIYALKNLNLRKYVCSFERKFVRIIKWHSC